MVDGHKTRMNWTGIVNQTWQQRGQIGAGGEQASSQSSHLQANT